MVRFGQFSRLAHCVNVSPLGELDFSLGGDELVNRFHLHLELGVHIRGGCIVHGFRFSLHVHGGVDDAAYHGRGDAVLQLVNLQTFLLLRSFLFLVLLVH